MTELKWISLGWNEMGTSQITANGYLAAEFGKIIGSGFFGTESKYLLSQYGRLDVMRLMLFMCYFADFLCHDIILHEVLF